SLCPGSETSYLIGAGTSFASPHAAGEAAVVKTQSTTHIAGAALETCVLNTASNVAGKRPDINYNFGRIGVLSAVKSSGCKYLSPRPPRAVSRLARARPASLQCG